MSDDTISRQEAIDALDAICDRECEYPKKQRAVMCAACHLGSAFDVIDELPSAVRRGRWVKGDEMADYPRVPYKSWETYCSCCGAIKEQSNDGFCGNCGARMEATE